MSMIEEIEQISERVARRVVAETSTPAPVDVLDDETRAAIKEQVLLSHKTYLTRKEAAQYLNVSERSIAEWSVRPANDNPFPERRAGGEPRTKREDIDAWAAAERRRQALRIAS